MSRKRGRGSLLEYGQMVTRLVRAYGRAFGETGDLPELTQMANIREELEASTQTAVDKFREVGFSWVEIGESLKMSSENARRRYGIAASYERGPLVYALYKGDGDLTLVGGTRNLGQRLAMHQKAGLRYAEVQVLERLEDSALEEDIQRRVKFHTHELCSM